MKGSSMEKKSIGAFIAVLRKSAGMTQRDLAERLAVSDKTVSHWERDESAPDLTLIPVIAEIFGVTCDELLRGERKKDASEAASGKTEKQIKHLLCRSREKFGTRSMISLGLSVLGLFAAMICNFGFDRAYLGFLIGCIFWASAIICESVFIPHTFYSVGDDFEGDELNDYKIYAVRLAEKIISAAAIIFCASLPLIMFPYDTFQGLTAGTWLGTGLLASALGAIVCLSVVYAVNNKLIKKGVFTFKKEADIKRHKLNRLKIRCAALFAVILLAVFTGQALFNSILGAEVFAAGTTFHNFADFKAYIETEKPEEIYQDEGALQLTGVGITQEYSDINEDPNTEAQDLTEYIFDNEGNVLYQYVHRNGEVRFIKYDGAGTDRFSITTYTAGQLSSGQAAKGFINVRFIILYFIVIGAGFLVYFRKRAKLGRQIKG